MPTLRQIAQATLLRFFPAAATGLLALTAALVPGTLTDMPLGAWLYLGGILGVQSLGFAATLLRIRHRLQPGAQVAGRRSVIVGALSSGLLLVVATSGQTFLPQWGLWLGATLTGAAAAAAMYWPWLERGAPPALPRNPADVAHDVASPAADKIPVGRRRGGAANRHRDENAISPLLARLQTRAITITLATLLASRMLAAQETTPASRERGCQGYVQHFELEAPFMTMTEFPVITGVTPGTPAALAGLQVGDSVVTVAGRDSRERPKGPPPFFAPGDSIALTVRRKQTDVPIVIVFGRATVETTANGVDRVCRPVPAPAAR